MTEREEPCQHEQAVAMPIHPIGGPVQWWECATCHKRIPAPPYPTCPFCKREHYRHEPCGTDHRDAIIADLRAENELHRRIQAGDIKNWEQLALAFEQQRNDAVAKLADAEAENERLKTENGQWSQVIEELARWHGASSGVPPWPSREATSEKLTHDSTTSPARQGMQFLVGCSWRDISRWDCSNGRRLS